MTRNALTAFSACLIASIIAIFLMLPSRIYAQINPEESDLKIDPEVLKNATSSELQRMFRDLNKDEGGKQGEDLHRRDSEQQVVVVDSTINEKERISDLGPQSVFGTNIFQNKAILQLADLSTPPDDYIIGAGDQIIVSLWGGADFEEDYLVGRDGSIFPRGLGKITVQGLTYYNARSIISDRFKKVIPAGTNISVAMGQPRSIVVQVSGNVQNPGPVVVSAFTNPINVVAQAGGMTEYGDLRKILLSRNGKVIDSIDIYEYLYSGNFGNHTYLENNDFIIVPFYEKKVLATGQFKRPMYYQLKQEEGIKDLIRYSGGFNSDAYISAATIIRNQDEKQVIRTINLRAIGAVATGKIVDAPLFDGDIVAVGNINPGLRNKVTVIGEIAYPNIYEVRPGDRLFDVLNRAGGVTPNTYLDRAYVYKGAGDSTTINSERIEISLKDFNVNLNSKSNISIEPNDVIELFSISQFGDRQMVSINGEVRKPGRYQKYKNMTLKDLLYFANGLKPSAEFGSILVSSVVSDEASDKITPVKTIIKTYPVNHDLALDSITENVVLKPFDQVFVRRNPKFQLQQNIVFNGQVLYPGTYPKLEPDERLTSFIKRAGGLNPGANPEGAFLFRKRDSVSSQLNVGLAKKFDLDSTDTTVLQKISEGDKVSIFFDMKKAIENPGSKYDLELKEGDVIYIPSQNRVVSIKGTVQNELNIYYDEDHPNIGYYIDKAGGFNVRPWRKRIFVTYANGTSKRTKNFLFLHFYPKVKSGSTITVPERPEAKFFSTVGNQAIFTTIPLLITYLITRIK